MRADPRPVRGALDDVRVERPLAEETRPLDRLRLRLEHLDERVADADAFCLRVRHLRQRRHEAVARVDVPQVHVQVAVRRCRPPPPLPAPAAARCRRRCRLAGRRWRGVRASPPQRCRPHLRGRRSPARHRPVRGWSPPFPRRSCPASSPPPPRRHRVRSSRSIRPRVAYALPRGGTGARSSPARHPP